MKSKYFWSCLSILVIALASCTSKPVKQSEAEAPVALVPKTIYKQTSTAIFEVVIPKVEDSFVQYEKALPVDKLSYRERNDHYRSIGTAFAIDQNRFVSASHVFLLYLAKSWKDFYLRDQAGEVYKVNNILKYSTYRDLVEFSLEKIPSSLTPLIISKTSEVADTVYVVGNALGEGISFRVGQIASFTPEERDNKWKFIRISAPASPGNSGGPLLNDKGEVIGIVVRKSMSENLNYAVPIAELDNLSTSKAEFSFVNLKISRDQVSENKNYNFSTDLPGTPAHLSEIAQKTFADFYKVEFAKLYDPKDERFLPANPNFQEYIRHQPHPSGVSFVISESKGAVWNNQHPKPASFHTDSGSGSVQTVRYKNWFIVNLGKPAAKSLKSFVADPQLIMERVLKGLQFSRTYGNEKILLTSLGKPIEETEWSDNFGRLWNTYTWKAGSLESFYSLDCLPVPRGLTCNLNYGPLAASGFIPVQMERSFANQLMVPYSGTISEWQEFLTLDKKYLSPFLKQVKINLKEGKELVFTAGMKTLTAKNEQIGHKSEILVRPQYSATTQLGLEVQDIEVVYSKDAKKYFMLSSLMEPMKNSPDGVKKRWESAKSHQDEFNEEVHTKADKIWVYLTNGQVQATTPPTLNYVICGDDNDASKDTLLSDCKTFSKLNGL